MSINYEITLEENLIRNNIFDSYEKIRKLIPHLSGNYKVQSEIENEIRSLETAIKEIYKQVKGQGYNYNPRLSI